MSRRKSKKRENKLYCFGDGKKQLFSYHEKREARRESHELSIAYARKEGRNYWDGWKKGYPNRLRLNTLLKGIRHRKYLCRV